MSTPSPLMSIAKTNSADEWMRAESALRTQRLIISLSVLALLGVGLFALAMFV